MAKNQALQVVEPVHDEDEIVTQFEYSPQSNGVRKAPRGRPRIRPRPTDPGILEAICERIARGDAVNEILGDEDCCFPTKYDHYKEMAINLSYQTAIARAKQVAQDALMDKCDEIMRNATPETAVLAKTQVWWYQWQAAKLLPKKYGEKIQIEDSTGTKDVQLNRNEFEDIAYKIVDDV